jgi:hypothetical protein
MGGRTGVEWLSFRLGLVTNVSIPGFMRAEGVLQALSDTDKCQLCLSLQT